MKEIKINKITETKCKLYNPENKLIGEITNCLELADVRIQIQKNKVNGYYIIWKDRQISINNFGCLDEYPTGFYDTMDIQLETLLGL
jgi:predicted ATPase